MKKTIVLIFLVCCSAFGQTNKPTDTKEPKFVFIANVGQGFRLAKISDNVPAEYRDYAKDLKTGLAFDLSAYYMYKDRGYGLKYNVFQSDNRNVDNGDPFDPVFSPTDTFSDDITITYVGPSFIYSENQDAKVGEAFFEFSVGYISYLNRASIYYERFKIKGGNIGVVGGGGYHFRINKNILVGPQVSFVGGTLKKFKLEYSNGTSETIKLEKDDYENLWRIDLSVSAKFRF